MFETVSSAVFLVAMGVWLGGVVFFQFFTAPVIFERLPRNQAADLIAVMFPRYYRLGYVCGAMMIVAGLHPIFSSGPAMAWLSWSLACVALAASAYAGMIVMPRVGRLRQTAASSAGSPEHSANRSAYNRAHQLSLTLNAAVLVLLIAQALVYAWRVKSIVS